MSHFPFRLATLLRLREAARDQLRIALAEACRADEELADQLIRLGLERQRLQAECRAVAEPGAVDIDRLVETHRYVSALRLREKDLQEQRRTAAVEIDRRRQSLVEADQNVQALEKLRDRRFERHRLEEERQEAKHLDEIALQAVAS